MANKKHMTEIQMSPSIKQYLEEISAYPPLSHEQERVLARRIRAGDKQALDKLVNANLKFVVTIAKNYQGQGLPLQDLIGEGNIGLIKAAHRFDETKGFKFISYAVWWIRQCILQALADQARGVRLPLNRINAILQYGRATETLQKRLGREPSLAELAKEMGMSTEEVAEVIRMNTHDLALDQPSTDDEESDGFLNLLASDQYLPPDEMMVQESLQQEIDAVLSKLEPRTAEIVRRYFGLNGYRPHSLEMLGNQFNLTRERVRQIKKRALEKLRRRPSARTLREYL